MLKSRLAKNTIYSLLLQICTIVSGFVIPRLILRFYGSEVNGLVNSIAQFLHLISFMELGISAVVQSSLYSPLRNKDDISISKIVVSASKFFRIVGVTLLVYVVVLTFVYPLIVRSVFDYFFTALLILAMSIHTFCQYYFGIVDYQLLTADQKGYIQYITQTICLIVSTLLSVLIIFLGGSIHLVKLVTSLCFLVRPIVIRTYVNHHYNLDRRITYTEEPIKQKWNGIAQHVSAVVLDQTDVFLLTILSTLSNVSIYSVYHLVVYGVKTLFTSMTNGIQAMLGNVWASEDEQRITDVFSMIEWILHNGVIFFFGCTAVLILPFVSIYTLGITDANYYQPIFSLIIVSAHATHCLRLPYHILIKAGGKYKETQNSYFIAAFINIIISVITIRLLGLVGVAIGTLLSMLYQTIWMAYYCQKEMITRGILVFWKQVFTDILCIAAGYFLSSWIPLTKLSYVSWILLAIKVSIIWLAEIVIINLILYPTNVRSVYVRLRQRNTKK